MAFTWNCSSSTVSWTTDRDFSSVWSSDSKRNSSSSPSWKSEISLVHKHSFHVIVMRAIFFLLYFDKKSIFCQNCAFLRSKFQYSWSFGMMRSICHLSQILPFFDLSNPNFDQNLGLKGQKLSKFVPIRWQIDLIIPNYQLNWNLDHKNAQFWQKMDFLSK